MRSSSAIKLMARAAARATPARASKATFVATLISMACIAQNAIPPLGKKAPELEIAKVLQAPAGTKPLLSELRGKTVLL